MNETATMEQPTVTPTESILRRSVALVLRCGKLGNDRRIELGSVEMKKDGENLEREKSELGATKRLFSKGDLRPAEAAVSALKHRLRAMSVDGGTRIFGDGTYLIPVLGVQEALQALKDGKALVAAKAEEVVARLPHAKEQRKAKLGPLYDEADYPTPDEVRAAYRVEWNFVSFQTPEQLEEVDAAAYAEAVHQQDARLASAYQDVVIGLREGAALVMRELAERLKPGEDGKPKALRPTALRDLQDLLGRLPVLNSVAEDDALAGVLARVGVLAEGLDVETLRKAPAIRGMLLTEAEVAAQQLEALVVTGRRAMDLS